jgi:hypothetical protein
VKVVLIIWALLLLPEESVVVVPEPSSNLRSRISSGEGGGMVGVGVLVAVGPTGVGVRVAVGVVIGGVGVLVGVTVGLAPGVEVGTGVPDFVKDKVFKSVGAGVVVLKL